MPVVDNAAKSIFINALALSRTERTAYLDSQCVGNASLRLEVEDLLAVHDKASGWLDSRGMEEGIATAAISASTDRIATGGSKPVPAETDSNVLKLLGPAQEAGSLGRLDHYEVRAIVGRGGFGAVLKAWDTKLLRIVAIKVLAPHLSGNRDARKRFVREAQASAAVRDVHVVPIHFVQDDGPVPYMVMEFVEGGTLADQLRKGQPMDVHETLRIGRELALGLASAHALGIVHRDVKPANLLLDAESGHIRLTDFGLARAVAVAEGARMTAAGTLIGTPSYMSPEQARGLPVDARTDLFSLGVVLYQMATGDLPFRGSDVLAILASLALDSPIVAAEKNPRVPRELSDLIARLLDRDPSRRPATALSAAEELKRILDTIEQLSPAAQMPPTPKAFRKRLSRKAWLASAILVLAASGVGMLILPRNWQRPTKAESPTAANDAAKASQAALAIQAPALPIKNGCDIMQRLQSMGGRVARNGDRVEHLNLDSSSATDDDLRDLAHCDELKAVKRIDLGRTAVTGDGLKHLAGFPELERVTFYYAPGGVAGLSGTDLAGLRGLKLVELDLEYCSGVGDNGMDHVATFVTLNQLYLRGTSVTDLGVRKLGPLTALSAVTITGPFISNDSVETLCRFTSLKRLCLDGSRVDDDGVGKLSRELANLQHLELRSTRVSNSMLAPLVKNCRLLHTLIVDYTEISDDGLKELEKLPNLTLLSLAGNRDLTDGGLEHLVKCRNMKGLDVRATDLTKAKLVNFSKRLPDCLIQSQHGVFQNGVCRAQAQDFF